MESLICPKCGGNLEQIIYQGIEVDRCCQCAGIWFDSLEAEQLKNRKGSETIDPGYVKKNSVSESLEEPINCPRCQVRMMKMLDFDQHPIWYEICLNCQGIWFDAGEFTQFKRNFKQPGLLVQAMKVLRYPSKINHQKIAK
ncbi:hypothetical protein PCC8801_2502 [Rippkaea orientalis PCC 8801]|uniref:Transcription factor zinc-finger domain-containing protein n=1 Tax=Rippkaea orientalis (strain PCC 8801 / RF-1) TaxID=41431 RepID=B7K3X0_RIPO1|nr:zf-TFIIB domain-containing protein [Rippkaea orientalis]ACK66510.1 hypothetical protein PCC8801_2502 [Rippkaea orientalis PCC 8801]